LHDVSLFDLISAFGDVLKRVKTEELKEIFSERFTVAEKMEHIVRRLQKETRIEFGSLFAHLASRHEIVCTFLALLELIRLRQLVARQESTFGSIMLMPTEGL
jgi:segregation and condensation protein A